MKHKCYLYTCSTMKNIIYVKQSEHFKIFIDDCFPICKNCHNALFSGYEGTAIITEKEYLSYLKSKILK